MTEPEHPLPWQLLPTGDTHVVLDAEGEIVYSGPDPAELVRLCTAAVEEAKEQRGRA